MIGLLKKEYYLMEGQMKKLADCCCFLLLLFLFHECRQLSLHAYCTDRHYEYNDRIQSG